jgi:hypothetical protein
MPTRCEVYIGVEQCPNEAVDYREVVSVIDGESYIVMVCEEHTSPPEPQSQ